ncbi:MAG TPA: TraB/GumN family protein [Burkholderiales bacterium]|nr:TraB/GumN family protein [Burkholderiales bacterium]
MPSLDAARVRAFLVILALILPAPARVAGRFEQGLLWRVETPGIAPSYLFGTLHSDDERVVKLSPKARRAFDRAGVVAMEALGEETATRRYRAAMVGREPQLPALLGEDYARVEALLRESGVPREIVPRIKPWAALIILLQPRDATGLTLDNLLLFEAGKRGKPIVHLESVEEQIEALDGMAPETQVILLRDAQARFEEIQAAVYPTLSAYAAGDLAAQFRINAETMGAGAAQEAFLQRLLYARSERFAERLAPLLKQGGVFAAFGALHLYGPRGVPALLERRGFRVTRVR